MAEAATATNIAPHEMRAAIRGAVGNRDITRNLGLGREQAVVVDAAMGQVRAAQGREALATLAGETVTKFSHGGWEAVLEAKLYTGFAPDGSRIARPGTNEGIRFNQTRDTMHAYEDYMAHGFDNLKGSAAEITRKRQILREGMHDMLVSNDIFRQALAPAYAPHTIPTAVVEEALRDEGIGRELAKVLNDIFKEPIVITASDETFTTKVGLEEAAQKRRELASELDRQNDDLKQATNDRNNFNTQVTYHTASIPARSTETRASAMVALQGELAVSTEPSVRDFKANLDNQQKLLDLIPPPTDLQARLDAIVPSLESARKDTANGAHCREFESLYRQQHGNTQRMHHAQREITRLAGEIGRQDIEIAKKQASLDLASTKTHAGSGDFALSINEAFAEAAKKHLADRAGKFIDTYRAERDKATKDAVTEQTKQVDEYIGRRWIQHRPQSFLHQWRSGKESLNGGRAKNDFATFIGRGADALVADVLRDSGILESQQAFLLQDAEFMKTKRTEVVGKVLAAYVVTGGKLKKGQIDALAMSDYGKGAIKQMEDAQTAHEGRIDQALAAEYIKGVAPDSREQFINGAPGWLITKPTLRVLLSPMHLIRPLAIQLGKFTGSVDVAIHKKQVAS